MKSLKIPMTVEEFEVADFPFGWKDEYCDGFAYFTPREHGVLMKIDLEERKIETSIEIQSISEASLTDLTELFYDSFVDSVEFYGLKKSEIRSESERNIKSFFNGERGIPQIELCRIAKKEKKLIGACLIAKYKYGFKNEILFVDSAQQRKGIGTALVTDILNNLHKKKEEIFWSEYHICNELSANWHKRFGFMEEPDIMTAKFRRSYLRHQVWRNEKLGNLEKVEELKLLLKQAESEVDRLEKIEEEDFDAAWLRWKYDF